MKVKVIKYCHENIDGHLTVLDINRKIDINDQDAHRLIASGVVEKIDNQIIDVEPSIGNPENKMVNILYKKRGRPRKEG